MKGHAMTDATTPAYTPTQAAQMDGSIDPDLPVDLTEAYPDAG